MTANVELIHDPEATLAQLGETELDARPYEPRGAALELFYDRSGEVLIEGPGGTGKTRAALEKVFLLATIFADSRHLLCRKTRVSMTQSVLQTWERHVVPVGHRILAGPGRANRMSYVFPNGSEVVVGGLDNPDRIMSTEYDTIVIFEATEADLDDAEKLVTRLRSNKVPYQQLIYDCNPGVPSHWLNQRADGPTTRRLLSVHADNPYCDAHPEYVQRLSASLTGARRERLLLGKWAAAEGLVYETFSRSTHVLTWAQFHERYGVADGFGVIPKAWRRVRVVDFGFKNPFVCQWWAADPDSRWIMYREIYMTERRYAEHGKQMKALSKGERIETTLCDHDAEGRAQLEDVGIYTEAASKTDAEIGIQDVQKWLLPAGDGRPQLFYMADALVEVDAKLADRKLPISTIQEFDCYLYHKDQKGRALKEVPVKEHDHGMDCTRYLVRYADVPFYTVDEIF